jgi:hypothetical protein
VCVCALRLYCTGCWESNFHLFTVVWCRVISSFVKQYSRKMAATGVAGSDEVISQFNDVKLGRVTAKFLIYKIENGQIVTESTSNEQSFDAFVNMLPADDCRYAIYDMNFTTTDGRPGNKLVSITWYVTNFAKYDAVLVCVLTGFCRDIGPQTLPRSSQRWCTLAPRMP